MSYADVLVYWQNLGRPADMDDDSDGLPCETVFGQQNAGLPELVGGTHSCSKLSELGFSYADTRTYWLGLGAPADMDDDHDGKPCESVYGQR